MISPWQVMISPTMIKKLEDSTKNMAGETRHDASVWDIFNWLFRKTTVEAFTNWVKFLCIPNIQCLRTTHGFSVCLWLQEFIILTGLDFSFQILVKWSEFFEQQLSGISFEKNTQSGHIPCSFLSEFIVFRGAFYQNSIEFKVHLACFALVHGYPTRWSAGRDGWNPTSARAGLGICRCPGAWKTCKLGEILIGAMMVSPCFTNQLGFQQ